MTPAALDQDNPPMADDSDSATKMPFGVDFGPFIAFFLPGAAAVLGLSFACPPIAGLIDSMTEGEAVAGPSILLAVAALTIGLILSGARGVIVDGLMFRSGWIEAARSFDFKNLNTEEKRWAFEGAVQNYYRYAQFYGNMLLAEVVFGLSRYVVSEARITWSLAEGALLVGLFVTGFVLLLAARGQLKAMHATMESLMK